MKLVIKLSGKVLEDKKTRTSVCHQLARLAQQGNSLVLVHGGGKQLSSFSKKLGIPVVQHQGRRITNEDTLEVAKMVFSAINRDFTAQLTASGVRSVGISAFDGFLTQARRREPLIVGVDNGRTQLIDFGLVGDIENVDHSLVTDLWDIGIVPVVSCLCSDEEGQILNINADTLATELATSLEADRLIAVSDVDGIYLNPTDPSTKIRMMDLSMARTYLDGGVFLDGMIPKVQNAIRALEQGVSSFQVVSGLHEGALLDYLDSESGTVLIR